MSEVDFPDWAGFAPEKAAAELPRLLEEAEKAVAAIECGDRNVVAPTYEDFVWKLDDATRELWRCWGAVGHMLGVMNSEAWRKLEEELQPKVVAFSLRVSQSKRLYEIAKSLLNETVPAASRREALARGTAVTTPRSEDAAGTVRRRILEKMVQGAELAGVGLEGEKKARFNEIQMRLAQLGSDFHNAVIDATGAFKFEKDGKTYTIDDASYPETMKHCADREVREKLYRARATRAPENEKRIDEILKLRQEEAEILGFANYAEKSLATKCAPSVAAVGKMIDDLDAATAGKAEKEEEDLLTSGRETASTFTAQPWDRAYLAERLREKKYAYSEEELKKFFELEDVVKGLFRMTKFLFGVDVEEVGAAAENGGSTKEVRPPVWHEDVRFFVVKEKGETVAHFYFDPYVRNGLKSGGAWMNEFRNRSVRGDRNVAPRIAPPSGLPWAGVSPRVGGGVFVGSFYSGAATCLSPQLPLAVVVTNFPQKDENGKSYLPFREVETLFHEFGHALQCMLTRVDEEDAAGINLVEWDAVEVASQFLENWCLDDRTGISVPAELKAKVRAAKNFRAATACRRQLAFAKVDLMLHSRAVDGNRELSTADALKAEVFGHFGLPMIPEDRFLCAFTHIFAGGYAAGYYGYKWAEVMSADCYGAFEEAGLADDAAMRRIGARYRETVLALGGSKSALDVFRDFRGREPEIGALLRQQDLV